jgi:predicted O-methyltransferase YrrM
MIHIADYNNEKGLINHLFMIHYITLFSLILSSLFSELSSAEKSMFSYRIDYKETCSELCLIGAHYDTDKSSQRQNVTDERHCHPYTLFYHSLFKDKRNADLAIAELGILEGASLLMWRDYFNNATIYGFDANVDYINSFKKKYDTDRIKLKKLDVSEKSTIAKTFQSLGVYYDLIIDDTTHQFQDQLRIIEAAHPYLKPGGMLVIEDVFKSYNEQDYYERLKPIADLFQDYYFVTMDHKNRCSTGWDNDKILVLVKAGAEPIFKNNKKITIITPSMRPLNLPKLRDSIDFSYVDEWIIVYDSSKISENPKQFANSGNPKIKEYLHSSEGISGNPQRNFALDHVQNEDTFLYFLDDDNLMHKDFYRLLNMIDDGKIYTFDMDRIPGHRIGLSQIDTAMFLADFKICQSARWLINLYGADFYYIEECYAKNRDKWIYVNNILCTNNILCLPAVFEDRFEEGNGDQDNLPFIITLYGQEIANRFY